MYSRNKNPMLSLAEEFSNMFISNTYALHIIHMARFSFPLTRSTHLFTLPKDDFFFICMKYTWCPKFRGNISISASDVLQTSVRGRLVPQVNVLWNNCEVFHFWNKHFNFSRAWWHVFILQWVSGTYSWRNISIVLLAYEMENSSFHNFRNPRFSTLSRNLAPQYENSTKRTARCNELCGECPCNKATVQWESTCSSRTDRQMVGEADGRTKRRTDRDDETNSLFSQFFERG